MIRLRAKALPTVPNDRFELCVEFGNCFHAKHFPNPAVVSNSYCRVHDPRCENLVLLLGD